jgi:hypothetical protein
MENVALERIFLGTLQFSPVIVNAAWLHIHIAVIVTNAV